MTTRKTLLKIALLVVVSILYLSQDSFGRKVTLTKTGGNNTLDISGITLVSNYSQGTITNTIDWDEANLAGTVANWTDIFNCVAKIVNNDPERVFLNVAYIIDINSPDELNPMMIGKQELNHATGYCVTGLNILHFGDWLPGAPRINKVTITTTQSKAFLKYVDDLKYGAWIKPGGSVNYYVVTETITATSVVNHYYSTENNWSASGATYNYIAQTPHVNSDTTNVQHWDSIATTFNYPWKEVYGDSFKAYVGYFVEADNCNQVTVDKIEIDGNSQHLILGGMYGDSGIQLAHSGVYYYNCKNSHINNCVMKNFGLDGLSISGDVTDSITGLSNQFLYNGRQGLSWTGGKNLQFTNCDFSNTGKAINIGTGMYFGSSPSCGLDIEPEKTIYTTPDPCENGAFTDCRFQNNTFSGVISNTNVNNVKNIYFYDCTFSATNNYGIWVEGLKFKFDSCHIYGQVVHSGYGNVLGEETIYQNCDFEDKPYLGTPISAGRLVSIDGRKRTQFNSCTFKVNDDGRELMYINNGNYTDKSTWTVMDNCTFIYNNVGTVANGNFSSLLGVKFRGKNLVQNINNAPNTCHGIATNPALLEGSANACDPNSLTFVGKVQHGIMTPYSFEIGKQADGTSDGYATYKIKNGALGSFDNGSNIEVGVHSSMEIANGGSFRGFGNVNLFGKWLQNAGSYADLYNSSNIQTNINNASSSLFYIDPTCNANMLTIAPIWANSLGICSGGAPSSYNSNWAGFVYNNANGCIQGNHPTIPTPPSCTAPNLFSNISTNGAFTIMYNTTTNSGATDINYSPSGANYTASFDGVTTTANPITGLTTGTHTLVLHDNTTGCDALAYINLGGATSPCQPELTNVSNIMPLDNKSASFMITQNSNNATFYYKTFLVDGTLTIDANINFHQCLFLMKPNAVIVLDANTTMDLHNCILKSACGDMWNGIIADNPSEQIIIEDGDLLDMENGIQLLFNAKGIMNRNIFKNNHESIKIYENTLASNVVITENTFTFSGCLLAPYSLEKPLHGIYIDNCSDVNIGNASVATSGNHFENLWNGVAVNIHTFQVGNSIGFYPYAKVQLFNNTFKNIKSDQYANSLGYDEAGSAVYGTREDFSNVLQMNVWNTLAANANTNESFEDCEKAIWWRRASGFARNQKVKNGIFGMVASECDGQKLEMSNNKFQDTYVAIVKSGDEAVYGFKALNNVITLPQGIETGWLQQLPPMGFYDAYSSSTHVGSSNIANNIITMPKGNNGTGIEIYKGLNDIVSNNQIHMTTIKENAIASVPNMLGIYANDCQGIQIGGNTVDNGGANLDYVKTNNAGIYINTCKESRLACNTLNFTKYGILAVGQNGSTSNYDKTVGNVMNNSDANLLLWALANEGTLGQVGNLNPLAGPVYDGNNTYTKQANGILNNVFRISNLCQINFVEAIVTPQSKLAQGQSSSISNNGSVCNVSVPPPPSTFTETYICNGGNATGPQPYPIDIDYATLVANNDIVYSEYIEGARRADEEMVMNWLENSANARASNPILDSFYLARNATIVGQVNAVDRLISLLNDSTLRSAPEQWMTTYNQAHTMNNALGGTLVFEQNAKAMNKLYLNTLLSGSKTINQEQEAEIEILAFTCPYLGGNAVFRARALHGMKHFGIHYDDLEICNGQGVFKGGMSKLQEQLNQLANYNLNIQNEPQSIREELVIIYPNPAINNVTLSCKSSKKIVIYDLLGNTLLSKTLNHKEIENKINVSMLNTGIYIYKVLRENNEIYNGKLIIE